MPFRFPQRQPRDATELFEWLRELLPQLEAKILENCVVGTTVTAIPHGLGHVPFFVHADAPHCIAVVRQVKKADAKNVYLRATNPCVVNVLVLNVAQLAQLTTSMRNGGYHLPDWDPLANDDHLLIVDDADEIPATLINSLKGNSGVSYGVVVDGGKRKVEATVNFPAPPADDHLVIAVPGDSADVLYQKIQVTYPLTETVAGTVGNQHVLLGVKQLDPVVDGQKLYTAHIYDPRVRNARFVFRGASGCGLAMMFDGWTNLGPGVWRATTAGDSMFSSSMCDGVVPANGDIFMACANALPDEEWAYTGLYKVIDYGFILDGEGHVVGSSYPTVQRIDTADEAAEFEAGLYVEIAEGLLNAGKWYHLLTTAPIVLETTPLHWEVLDSFFPASDQRLLTIGQLSASNVDPATIENHWGSLADGVTVLGFPTLGSTGLGLTKLPAGRDRFQLEVASLDGYPVGGDVWIDAVVSKWQADHYADRTVLYTAPSQKLYTIMPTPLAWFYDHGDIALDELDNLALELKLRSTTGGTVGLTIRWNSTARGTWWLTTAQFAIPGTTDHRLLDYRDVADQHPTRAISPKPKADVTITAGVMPAVAYGSWANVTSASTNLDAIDIAGTPDELEVYFGAACAIRDSQSTTGTNRPIRTYKSTFATYQTVNVRIGSTVHFRYRPDLGASGMWLITGVQQG